MYQYVFWTAVLLVFFSCSNEPKSPSVAQVPPDIWAQYKVWAEEGDSLATCMLQFYADAQMSQTLLLEAPSGVQIDGQSLEADSAGIVGAFYEYQSPVGDFNGRHQVQFTDLDKQVFVDSFSFHPFQIVEELPAVLAVQDYELPLQGLPDGSSVRVVLTDTSAEGSGVNELVRVKAGKLPLPAAYWEGLFAGPVIVHLTAEEERPLRSMLRGELLVTYGLSRVVELRK